jgi:uncharacterized protein
MDLEHLKKFKYQILELAAVNKALNIRVFGSVSRQQTVDDSDIDFLIDVGEGQNLIDFIRLQQELEDLLGLKVDLASSTGLREGMRDSISRDAIEIANL